MTLYGTVKYTEEVQWFAQKVLIKLKMIELEISYESLCF